MKLSISKNSGFTIIEILLACSIISVVSFSIISASHKGIVLSDQALRYVQAGFLLEEGAESVKIIRDNGWSNITNLSTSTTYYPIFNSSNNTWSLSTTSPGLIDGIFTRTVVFSSVLRDSNDDISSSGTFDSRTKKVTINISWQSSNGAQTKTLDFYLADIFS